MNKPFLKLHTLGVHRGVASFNMATSLDGKTWHWWGLNHIIAYDWYLYVLKCFITFGDEVIIEGWDKLMEWRSTLAEKEVA